jgi:hypothetical protein
MANRLPVWKDNLHFAEYLSTANCRIFTASGLANCRKLPIRDGFRAPETPKPFR